MRALDKKLWRDLGQMRGQVAAIVLVLGSGLATYLMSLGTLHSLERTLERFYAEQRFADVWLALKRAPEARAAALAEWPEVAEYGTRIVAPGRIELPDFADPVRAQWLSLPDDRPPSMNLLYLRRGRLPAAYAADEVVLSEAFAQAHGLEPGAELVSVIAGRRQRLQVVGIAISPEFIYQIQPGAAFPDFKRFAVGWMSRHALAAAFGMQGAFNGVHLKLRDPSATLRVLERLDRHFADYGGLGAYGREEQLSHKFLSTEFRQLRTLATVFPAVFLTVSAFLLNVVLSRMVAAQREQIAILKAFGYGPWAIFRHYLGMVGVIVLLGNLVGWLGGRYLAMLLADLYMVFYRFPYLDFALPPTALFGGAAISLLAAVGGAGFALRRAMRLAPAEAMRPEAPSAYRPTWIERRGWHRVLRPGERMILRSITRRPWKSAFTVLGIALSGAVVMLGSFQQDALFVMVDQQFGLAQRNDVGLGFTEPRGRAAVLELMRLPGVVYAEGYRSIPVRLTAGERSVRSVIDGHPAGARLKRVLVEGPRFHPIPAEGLVLTDYLAAQLGVGIGDRVRAEHLQGARRSADLVVVGLTRETIGVSGYMELEAMNRAFGEGERVGYVLLELDDAALPELFRHLEARPQVVGIGERKVAIQNFYKTMAESILIFTYIARLLAIAIAFGVLYNSARIALAERGRELASLRVLGLRRREVAGLVVGELALLTLLAIPLGMALGWLLCWTLAQGLQSELYRVPAHLSAATYTEVAIVVLLAALLASAVVYRRVARFDLVEVLKTRA